MRPEDAQELHDVQERSYEKAGSGIRESYPRNHAMDAGHLAAFLDGRRYAVLATSRMDGRSQAAPVAFIVWRGAFWVASVEGARVRNLRARPYASIVVMEGEGNAHRAVIAEGPVRIHDLSAGNTADPDFLEAYQGKHGDTADWARARIELRPERLYSYDATKGSKD